MKPRARFRWPCLLRAVCHSQALGIYDGGSWMPLAQGSLSLWVSRERQDPSAQKEENSRPQRIPARVFAPGTHLQIIRRALLGVNVGVCMCVHTHVCVADSGWGRVQSLSEGTRGWHSWHPADKPLSLY